MKPSLLSPAEFLAAVAEPTRLRILNCLAGAPLFVSDLQAILDVPQPTVSRHLRVLRSAQLVRDTPISQFVLYRLHHGADLHDRLLRAVLDTVIHEPEFKSERLEARERARNSSRARTGIMQGAT